MLPGSAENDLLWWLSGLDNSRLIPLSLCLPGFIPPATCWSILPCLIKPTLLLLSFFPISLWLWSDILILSSNLFQIGPPVRQPDSCPPSRHVMDQKAAESVENSISYLSAMADSKMAKNSLQTSSEPQWACHMNSDMEPASEDEPDTESDSMFVPRRRLSFPP